MHVIYRLVCNRLPACFTNWDADLILDSSLKRKHVGLEVSIVCAERGAYIR